MKNILGIKKRAQIPSIFRRNVYVLRWNGIVFFKWSNYCNLIYVFVVTHILCCIRKTFHYFITIGMVFYAISLVAFYCVSWLTLGCVCRFLRKIQNVFLSFRLFLCVSFIYNCICFSLCFINAHSISIAQLRLQLGVLNCVLRSTSIYSWL